MPYVVVESWSQEFEALIQMHELPSLQRQATFPAQQIHVHIQGMLPPFNTRPLEAPIQLTIYPFYSLLQSPPFG